MLCKKRRRRRRTEFGRAASNNFLPGSLRRDVGERAPLGVVERGILLAGTSVVGSDDASLVRRRGEDVGEGGAGVEASEAGVDHDFGGESLGGADGEDVWAATGVLLDPKRCSMVRGWARKIETTNDTHGRDECGAGGATLAADTRITRRDDDGHTLRRELLSGSAHGVSLSRGES